MRVISPVGADAPRVACGRLPAGSAGTWIRPVPGSPSEYHSSR